MIKRALSLLLSVAFLVSTAGIGTISYAHEYDPELKTVQSGVYGVDNSKSIADFAEFNAKRGDFTEDDSYVIPGLNSTVSYNKSNGYMIVETMVPQGMCRVGSYTLITSYDSEGDYKSVIYVLDSNHTLVKTLIMPDTHHAGGISYDSANKIILIAKSSKKTAAGLTYSDFCELMNSEQTYVRFAYSFGAASANAYPSSASGVSYYKGLVYVTSFNSGSKSIAYCYKPSWNADTGAYTLTYKYTVRLPNWTQGITVADYLGKTRLFVSVSYGRSEKKPTYTSYLYTYTFDSATGAKTLDNILACPPMIQQTYVADNKLYCLYESAAALYRKVNKCPLSMVYSLELSKLCDEQQGEIINIEKTKVNDGVKIDVTSTLSNAKIYYSTKTLPYYGYSRIQGASRFKSYVKDVSSPIYAVAVLNGKIVASDYINIKIKEAEAPKDLTLIKKTDKYVKITWTGAKGASGYYVYRSKSKKGTYEKIATVKKTKNYYKDKDVKPKTKYYYKVKAYKKGYRNSAFSNRLYVKTKKAPAEKDKE